MKNPALDPISLLAKVADSNQVKYESVSTAQDAARLFIEVRQFMEGLDEVYDRLASVIDKLAHERVPQLFETDQVSTMTIDGFRVTTSGLVRASTRDMSKGIEWCKGNGLASLVKETINASTLSAYAKQLMMEEGRELPEEIFNVHVGSNTSLTKVQK